MIQPDRTIPAPPLPLLITGITGVEGYNALRYFHSLYPGQVIGIRRPECWRLQGEGIVACSMADRDALSQLFDRYQFASVLSCEGNCALKPCELDPKMAWRINVETVENLLAVIGSAPIRLVHTSIDLVFSGTKGGNHVETDPTDPVTVYGKTMVVAEQLLLEKRPDACILRISLPMGVSFNGHAGALDWIEHRFKQQKPATLYFDEVRTPTYTDCLDEVCAEVLASDLRGIYHAGGPRQLSLYEIAQIINRVGGYPADYLMGCPRIDAGPMPPRAGDVTMNSQKLAKALGHEPFVAWPLDEQFVPTHQDWHRDRTTEWQGSPELLIEKLCHRPPTNGKSSA